MALLYTTVKSQIATSKSKKPISETYQSGYGVVLKHYWDRCPELEARSASPSSIGVSFALDRKSEVVYTYPLWPDPDYLRYNLRGGIPS